MKTGHLIVAFVVTGLAAVGGYALYSLGMNQGMQMGGMAASAAGTADSAQAASGVGDKKVLYWHDPMVPGQKFDKPGKSPFMDMQLVPVYASETNDDGKVSISPRVQQNLGVRVAEVVRGALTSKLEAVGSVAFNDRDVAVVQARSNGFVERLMVRALLDPVKKGQPLAEIYVPEWVAAQEEFRTAQRIGIQSAGIAGLADAAKQRMRLVGLSDEQIRVIEGSGEVQARFTLVAPISGVITELAAREGMTVMAGAPLFRINGLASVWVNADVPETAAAEVHSGARVEARTPALPGIIFKGKVSAILPDVNASTRTLKARIELANAKGQLAPGMFATVSFSPSPRNAMVLVPSEAVSATGKRPGVIVATGEGRFAQAEVELGIESNGQTEIRKGLTAGQRVVVSGQFLIDSEASLKGAISRMGDAAPATNAMPGAAADVHRGVGRVEAVAGDEITLSHEPIPSLKWGAMTMGFKAPAAGVPKSIRVGDRVAFEIRPAKDGMFEITRITADADQPKAMPSPAVPGTTMPGATMPGPTMSAPTMPGPKMSESAIPAPAIPGISNRGRK